MDEAALEASREYMRAYRSKNRERLNEIQRNWYKNNPDKVRAIKERYWNKKAKEKANQE